WILPQERAQRAGKGQSDLRLNRNLMNATNLVLDRILCSQDVDLWVVDAIDTTVQGRRLSATRRPRHQHNPVGTVDQAVHQIEVAVGESEIGQLQQDVSLVQKTHHDAFVVAAS